MSIYEEGYKYGKECAKDGDGRWIKYGSNPYGIDDEDDEFKGNQYFDEEGKPQKEPTSAYFEWEDGFDAGYESVGF